MELQAGEMNHSPSLKPLTPPPLSYNRLPMAAMKKKLILNTVSVDLGCSSCKNIFHPKLRHSKHKHLYYRSTSPSKNTNPSSSSSSLPTPPRSTVRWFGRVGRESVAVEKDSDDPYLDFRQSMLQMILEKEIYSKDELRELLNCFLQLNSSYHHGIIVRAFTEIWNGVFSIRGNGSDKKQLMRHNNEVEGIRKF